MIGPMDWALKEHKKVGLCWLKSAKSIKLYLYYTAHDSK